MIDFLKVSSGSDPAAVAGAIAGMVKDDVPVKIQCVGAGAVNQAVKAIAIANDFVADVGLELAATPMFVDLNIDDESRTGIQFKIVVWGTDDSWIDAVKIGGTDPD
jgi:stage V sporulation protein S